MSTFILYMRLGYRHVLDIYGVDHILFIIALMAVFLLRDWRKALVVILLYVIGNSMTMSVAALNVIRVNMQVIDYLIPVTIFLAASSNIIKKKDSYSHRSFFSMFMAFLFGLIHGFGFADYFLHILGPSQRLALPIIGFSIGVEMGMLFIAFLFLILTWIFVNNLGISRRDWNLVISSGIAGVALTLMFESRYWL